MKEKDGNKRRNKRHVVEGIEGNVLYTSDIEVLNLSIDGAAIETAKRLELNREYTFKIKYHDSFISLRGCVVWAILVSKVDKNNRSRYPCLQGRHQIYRYPERKSQYAPAIH